MFCDERWLCHFIKRSPLVHWFVVPPILPTQGSFFLLLNAILSHHFWYFLDRTIGELQLQAYDVQHSA